MPTLQQATSENKNPSATAYKLPLREAAAAAAREAAGIEVRAFSEAIVANPCGDHHPDCCKQLIGEAECGWFLDLDHAALYNLGVRNVMDLLVFVDERESVGDGGDASGDSAGDGGSGGSGGSDGSDSMSTTYDDPHFAALVATLTHADYQGLVMAQSLEAAATKYHNNNIGSDNIVGSLVSIVKAAAATVAAAAAGEQGDAKADPQAQQGSLYYGYRSEIGDQNLSVEDWVAAASLPRAVLGNLKAVGVAKMEDLDTQFVDETEEDMLGLLAGLKVVEARLLKRAVRGFRARTTFSAVEFQFITSSFALLLGALFLMHFRK